MYMYLAFFKAHKGKFTDWAIAAFSGRYSHVELIFPDGTWCGARQTGGVQYNKCNPIKGQWEYLKFDVTPEEEAKIRTFCDGEIGCGYDWTGALAFVIPWLKASKTRWFCSELVVTALQNIGMLKDAVPIKTTPVNIYETLILQ